MRVYARETVTGLQQVQFPDIEIAVKKKLAAAIADKLVDKIDYRSYNDPSSFDVVYEANLIAMSEEEFTVNYGNFNQRRGIADGTMAIMQNGNWKVVGAGTTSPLFQPMLNTPKPTPKKVEVNTKKSAVDYLTERMKNS